MNYELAKKLKDAGFPSENFCGKEDHGICSPDYPCTPTLSELIAACGDNFRNINRDTAPEWQANSYTGNPNFAYGSTPEEAVANLWLALNPPSNPFNNPPMSPFNNKPRGYEGIDN